MNAFDHSLSTNSLSESLKRHQHYEWPRMTCNITWKIRSRDAVIASSTIPDWATFCYSRKYQSILFVVYFFNSWLYILCNTFRYCELFAVDWLHSTLSLVAPYGFMRSDQGSYFVNKVGRCWCWSIARNSRRKRGRRNATLECDVHQYLTRYKA